MIKPSYNHIVVGVTGGIAAYKSPELVRRLRERGCEVRVVMRKGATAFITPLTLQAVSGHPVHCELLSAEAESGMGHIELARWADRVVIAPATADCMAQLANGLAGDLLSTLCLATTAPIALAPAMNREMWQHPATQRNSEILQERGVILIGPASGDQACGDNGPGRMEEPDSIVEALLQPADETLQGVNLLLTAGPTWEAIDPVRGMTNHSSGKMGFALAAAAARMGAEVTLIAGPVSLSTPAGVRRFDVTSAQEMLKVTLREAMQCDIFIGVAAVADYRPRQIAADKIKKDAESLTLELVRNPDILASVAALEKRPYCVGFAAETEQLLANAEKKLHGKRLDLIAANAVDTESKVFGGDNNTIVLLDGTGQTPLGSASKAVLSKRMLQQIADRYRAKKS